MISPRFVTRTIASFLLIGAAAISQEVRLADHLAPEDLGIQKYIFESKAPAGSVVVFRRDEYQDDRLVTRREIVSNTPTEKKVQSVLFIDWSVLKIGNGFELRGGGFDPLALLTARPSSSGFNAGTLEFKFDDAIDGRPMVRRVVFTMSHEKYADANQRIPQLRTDRSTTWSYLHSPTITSKQ